jgi:proteasome lid subunit RPN8/RPN11
MPDSKKKLQPIGDKEQIEFSNLGKVLIKYDAFRKIIAHVLRFANESKESSEQVLGVCVGAFFNDKKSFIISDAIPIMHGDAVELGFSQDIHDSINEVKENYSESNSNIIGWYHSHLGYGLYFSNSDKVNNLNFQNAENLYGFGIVIEQTLMNEGENYGFEVYRLKDHTKGADSNYIRVEFEIEPPNSMDFFRWVKELVESSQNKNTEIVYEFGEFKKPSPNELLKIPSTNQEKHELKVKEEFTLLYGIKDGMEKFSNSFINVYEQQLNSWMKDISEDVLIGNEYIRSSINNIKTTLASGLEDAQRIFNRIYSEISSLFVKNIKTIIDTRLENQIELKNDIERNTEEQLDHLFQVLEKEVRKITNTLEENMITIKNELEKIAKNNVNIEESLITNTELLNKIYTETDKLSNNVMQHIEKSSKDFETKLFNELQDFSSKMTPNKEIYHEIEELIERLQKVISDLRQIK